MNNDDPQDVEQIRHLDALCDQFEGELKKGNQPRIESYLDQLSDEALTERLLKELIALELHYQTTSGSTVSPDDLRRRFRKYSTVVDSILGPVVTVNLGPEATHAQAPDDPEFPFEFGNYIVLERVGHGGMGVVYKAEQKNPQRFVALKMIRAGALAAPEFVERFKAEANAVALLDHRHIVPIYDAGEHEGQYFFSMAFIDGQNLEDALKDSPISPSQAARLIRTLANAISHCHEEGIIHRDLKPANILLALDSRRSKLTPRITDFGLAKQTQSDSGMTETGQILGTPSYMPPEQASGAVSDIGPAADIYSLGAILYFLLTDRPPFRAATVVDTLRHVVEEEPVPPRNLNPSVDRDLQTICLKCLAKQPNERYSTAAELAEDLQRFVEGRPVSARPVGPLAKAGRWYRRNHAVVGLLVLVFCCLIGGSVTSAYFAMKANDLQGEISEAGEGSETAIKYAEVSESADQIDEQMAADRAAANVLWKQIRQRLEKAAAPDPTELSGLLDRYDEISHPALGTETKQIREQLRMAANPDLSEELSEMSMSDLEQLVSPDLENALFGARVLAGESTHYPGLLALRAKSVAAQAQSRLEFLRERSTPRKLLLVVEKLVATDREQTRLTIEVTNQTDLECPEVEITLPVLTRLHADKPETDATFSVPALEGSGTARIDCLLDAKIANIATFGEAETEVRRAEAQSKNEMVPVLAEWATPSGSRAIRIDRGLNGIYSSSEDASVSWHFVDALQGSVKRGDDDVLPMIQRIDLKKQEIDVSYVIDSGVKVDIEQKWTITATRPDGMVTRFTVQGPKPPDGKLDSSVNPEFQRAEPPAEWEIAPINTRAIVVVSNMSGFSAKVDRVAEAMELRQPGVLEYAMDSSRIRLGLNRDGDLLWLFGPKFQGQTPIAYLLPALNQEQVIRSVKRIKHSLGNGGQSQYEAYSMDSYVGVAETDDSSHAWLRVCRDNPGEGHKAIGVLNSYLRRQDLGFTISPQGLREGLKPTFPFSSRDYVFPSLLEDLVDPFSLVQHITAFPSLPDGLVDEFSLVQDITASAGGIRITEDADVVTSIAARLTAQGKAAKWPQTMYLDRDRLIKCVPDNDLVFLFGTAIPVAWKTAISEEIRTQLIEKHDKGPELARQLDLTSLRGLTLRIRPTEPDEHWTSSIQIQIHCRNAGDVLQAIRQWLPPFLSDADMMPDLKLKEEIVAGQLILTLSLNDLQVPTKLAISTLTDQSLLLTAGGIPNLQKEIAIWQQEGELAPDNRVRKACELVREECQMMALADVHRLAVWLADVYIEYAALADHTAGHLKHTVDTYGAMFKDAPPLILASSFMEKMTVTELALHHELLFSIGQLVRLFKPHLSEEFMK